MQTTAARAGQTRPIADIGFIDDGTALSGDVMNLMTRYNLLFDIAPGPGPDYQLIVQPESKQYSATKNADLIGVQFGIAA